MTKESGIDSGARNIGRFFLALIPWALGIGALVWLSVYIGVHTFYHEVQQENRAATYVGAAQRPKSKIAVKVKTIDCAHITKADLDGTDLLIYAQDDCYTGGSYFAWGWNALSPDGTIIASDYTNFECPVIGPHQKAECHLTVSDDDRIATLEVWVKTSP